MPDQISKRESEKKDLPALPDWVVIGKKVNFKNPSSGQIEDDWQITKIYRGQGLNKDEDVVLLARGTRSWPVNIKALEKFNSNTVSEPIEGAEKGPDPWVEKNLQSGSELSAYDPATKQVEEGWKISKVYQDDPEHVTLERTTVIDGEEKTKEKIFRVSELKAQNVEASEEVQNPEESKTLFDLELTTEQKAAMQQKLEEILDGSYIRSQEELRARERYGKTKFVSWLREYIGGGRIQVKEADVGLEISQGKNRRWWNPVIKLMIGGSAAASTIVASPAMAIGLGAVGASYLARGAVELGKLIMEKRQGIRQAIETSYLNKYKQMLELARETREQDLESNTAFAQAFEKLQAFISEADNQAIGQQLNAEARDDVKKFSIVELEAKQRKFEKKWKIAEAVIGFGASVGTGLALNEQLAANLLEGKRAALEELVNQKFQFDFDGDGVAHWLQKTKDGWVYLYNSAGEPSEIAKHLGTTQWLDKLNILQYGEHGAHLPGAEVAAKMESLLQAKVGLVESANAAQLAEAGLWLSSVLGALGLQSANDVIGAVIGERRAKISEKNRRDAQQAQRILVELTKSPAQKIPSQKEIDEIIKEAEAVMGTKSQVKEQPNEAQQLKKSSQEVQLESLSSAESESVLTRALIEGAQYEGEKLTAEIIRDEGLGPKHKLTIGDTTIYLSGPYELKQGRRAIVGYVEKEGIVRAKSYYQSNSQGLWRYLPFYLYRPALVFGKGQNEKNIDLPPEAQKGVSQVIQKEQIKKTTNDSYLIFLGTAPKVDEYNFRDEFEVNPITIKGKIKTTKGKIPPEKISINNEQSPNFSSKKLEWTSENDLYGKIFYETFSSKDGNLDYTFCRDKNGRTWIGSITPNSEVGAAGTTKAWVDSGDLTTPGYEYKIANIDQTGGYGNEDDKKNAYVDMFKNYLSKNPIIKEYLSQANKSEPSASRDSELEERIASEIDKLKEKYIGSEHQINLRIEAGKSNPRIQLEGRSFALLLNPAALIVLRRSEKKEFDFKVKIRDFVRLGNFIGVRAVAPTLKIAEDKPEELKPVEILANLRESFIGKKPEVSVKTAEFADKEYISFIFKLPSMNNLLYRFRFSDPNDFQRAKTEAQSSGSTNIEIKDIELIYDDQTGEPIYIFRV